MKEATGELNMTVITIVAIAALVAFFYLVIWPVIQTGMTLQSACSAAGGKPYTQTFDDGSSVDCRNNRCTYIPTAGNGSTTSRNCD